MTKQRANTAGLAGRAYAKLRSAVRRLRKAAAPRPAVVAPAAPAPALPAPPAKTRLKPANLAGRTLGIALVGTGGHGRKHIASFLAIEGCRIDYVCDVDADAAKQAAAAVERLQGHRPKVVVDLREPLADERVDIVSVATPHHWHALAAVWALRSGKHVYLEKPVSHTFEEGEVLCEAARVSGRVVQCGTQLRSNSSLRAAARYMQEGRLGDVQLVQCITYKPRPQMPAAASAPLPPGVDLDLWLGPAEPADRRRERFHYDWHWFWNFGNGALGNNGVHRVDVARIGIGLEGFGDAVLSYGGRYGTDDGGETPNVQICLHRFGEVVVFHDICGLPKRPYKTVRNGIIFYGSRGMIIYQAGAASLCKADGSIVATFPGRQENHYLDFIEAVLAPDIATPAGQVRDGHVSSGLCHLGNISQRLAAPASDADIARQVESLGAPEIAQDVLRRVRSNLVANGCDEALRLGPLLRLDPGTGRILDHPAAQALTRRVNRAGFGYGDFPSETSR